MSEAGLLPPRVLSGPFCTTIVSRLLSSDLLFDHVLLSRPFERVVRSRAREPSRRLGSGCEGHGPQTRLSNSTVATRASAVVPLGETKDRLVDAAQRPCDFDQLHVEIGGIAVIRFLDQCCGRAASRIRAIRRWWSADRRRPRRARSSFDSTLWGLVWSSISRRLRPSELRAVDRSASSPTAAARPATRAVAARRPRVRRSAAAHTRRVLRSTGAVAAGR